MEKKTLLMMSIACGFVNTLGLCFDLCNLCDRGEREHRKRNLELLDLLIVGTS